MKACRRQFLGSALLTVSAIAAGTSLAQARTVRIGVLAPRQRLNTLPAALKRLGELGFVEGKNLILEYRSAEGDAVRFPALARELIQAKCDLIFAVGTEHAARALLDAKTSIPVVILAVDYDPVKEGIVSNLRRPGANVTGVYISQPTLAAKRLELLFEIVPKAKRFLVLADAFSKDQLESVREAAKKLRVEIVAETFAAPPYDLAAAFAKGRAAGIEAVAVLGSPVFADRRSGIVELAMKHRLPLVGSNWRFTEAGFLLSYGPNPDTAYIRAGDIAASILKGAKPGDIPVEQPTVFELSVNRKTAKALGISIPPSILLRADRVIE